MALGSTILPLRKLFGMSLFSHSIWHELLEYARWCPSPHNVQPWKVKIITETEAHLFYEPARIPIVVDGTSAFTTVGMGMFIECLSIAAFPKELMVIEEHDGEEEMYADKEGLQPFARLFIKPSDKSEELNRRLIKERKTSRLRFDNRVIDACLVENLKAIANEYDQEFTYTTDQDLITYSINLNNESIIMRSQDKAVRQEMLTWIRTKDQEAAEKKDGWWYKCVGFPGKMLYNFFAHPEKFENKHKRTVKMLNKKLKGTRNLAWISGSFKNKSDWMKTGAMLQRMWLEMTKHNVYMSPFGPIVTTPKSYAEFKQRINYDERKGTLWFLIRLGYGDEPPRSFRMDTKDILI